MGLREASAVEAEEGALRRRTKPVCGPSRPAISSGLAALCRGEIMDRAASAPAHAWRGTCRLRRSGLHVILCSGLRVFPSTSSAEQAD